MRVKFSRGVQKRVLMLIPLLMAGCGKTHDQSDAKIIGGERVNDNDKIAVSTVALVQPSGHSFCSGTLVTPKHVVTAAHCLADYREDTLLIAFGTKAKLGSFVLENLRATKEFKVHEDFRAFALRLPLAPPADIAILELHEDAPAEFKSAVVLTARSSLSVGQDIILAGFGVTSTETPSSGVLNKVDTEVIATSSRMKEFTFGNSPGKSACSGDSGGPAYIESDGQLVLIGVTSRGSRNCDATGIYTDIRYYVDWMVDYIN